MDKELIKACIDDMEETGVLASVSLARILAGQASEPEGRKLKEANDGKRNLGKLLYPGIGSCRTFDEAARILGDDGTLVRINRRYGLYRYDIRRDKPKTESYKVTSAGVKLYTGPGENYAQYDHTCKKGPVEITEMKNGFGKTAEGWIRLSKCEKNS